MDHVILPEKLSLWGVTSHYLNWFRSYLTERKQQTFTDGAFSDFYDVTCGIPQGSVLGPILFTVYINDLPACNLNSELRMYADNPTLTLSAEDPLVLQQRMSYDMNWIQSLLSANELWMSKKKFMLIGSHYTLSHINNNFSVKVNNTQMDRVVEHKYLGVHIDEFLKWHSHVKVITKKISAGLAFLKSIRPFILFDTRMSMYNALVMPCFNYCSTVWGNIGIALADKIQKLQNRATRILTFLITRYAQMCYWMSLAGKDLKLLG